MQGRNDLCYKGGMTEGGAWRLKMLGAAAMVVLAVWAEGCSGLPERLAGVPEGDAAARRGIKKLAVVGFLVHYDLGPHVDVSTEFAPGSHRQAVVEFMFDSFVAELEASTGFKLVRPSAVRASDFYGNMEVNPDPRSRLSSTCPAGYRKIAPQDDYDCSGLARALGVDGLVLFEFDYRVTSGAFTRAARIERGTLVAVTDAGRAGYRRRDFSLGSGRRYFADYAWLRIRSIRQEMHCLGAVVREVARDFVAAFAPG